MKQRFLTLPSWTSLFVMLSTPLLADNEFSNLGDLDGGNVSSSALGVSADGSVVVGYSHSEYCSSGCYEAYRWTNTGGMVGLGHLAGGSPYSFAYGVSGDGKVVVGHAGSANGNEAFRWTKADGMMGLGSLSGGSYVGSSAYGANADGSVIVGHTSSWRGFEAFRWTEAGGMMGLGSLGGTGSSSNAFAVSDNGLVVVGSSSSHEGVQAFRWTEAGGMVGLGDLEGGDSEFSMVPGSPVLPTLNSSAFGVSADGSFVVGRGLSENGVEAFRWTESGGMIGLGDLPGGGFDSRAFDVSADGKVVVGWGTSASGYEAFRWLEGSGEGAGMQSIANLLVKDGVNLGSWKLLAARGVSDNGSVIVGIGTNPDGETEAWRAVIGTGLISAKGFSASLASMTETAGAAMESARMDLNLMMNVARHYGQGGKGASSGGKSTSAIPWSSLRFASNDVSTLNLHDASEAGTRSLWAVAGGGSHDRTVSESGDLIGSFGMSAQVATDLRLGAGLHIGQADLTLADNGGQSERDSFGFNGFIAVEPMELPLRLYAAMDITSLEDALVRRYSNGIEPETSEGKRDGTTVGGAFLAGWVYGVSDKVTLMPFMEYDVTRVTLDAYTETTGTFRATFDEVRHTSKVAKLGGEFELAQSDTLSLRGSLAWAHQYTDALPDIGGTVSILASDFSFAGAAMTSDWVEAGLGLTGRINEQYSFNASLDAAFDDDDTRFSGSIGLSIKL